MTLRTYHQPLVHLVAVYRAWLARDAVRRLIASQPARDEVPLSQEDFLRGLHES